MQAMLLAAGLGTRLRPYTYIRPKPLFPIVNKPLLRILTAALRDVGAGPLVVNCHWLADQIKMFFRGDPDIIIQFEPEILGTGGCLRLALEHFDSSPILVMNGDIFHSIDPATVYEHHVHSGNAVTLAVHDYPRFNNVLVKDERVLDFYSTNRSGQGEKLAFTGIHVVDPSVIKMMPKGQPFHITDLYQKLVSRGEQIGAFRTDGVFWKDIGTPDDYLQLHEEILTTDLGNNFSDLVPEKGLWCIDKEVLLDESVTLEGWGAIGRGAQIGKNALLSRCVVWEGARIPAGATLDRKIVTPNIRGQKTGIGGG